MKHSAVALGTRMGRIAVLATLSACITLPDAKAAPPPPTRNVELSDLPAEVTIPNTRRLDFTSRVNGHRYRLDIALPFETPPQGGYGVLYVLDGYWYFASAAEAVRAPDRAPGVVVVGISFPDDPQYAHGVLLQRGPVSPFLTHLPAERASPYFERMYDLSPPTSNRQLASLSEQGFPKWHSENFGGLDDFLRTIETEVKPRVAALAPIDTANQAIFGHSFGGSAVLHALFVEPASFRTFIIASPAIFWADKSVLADKGRFAAAIRSGKANPHVLVTVGSEESTPPVLPANWAMVQNGRDIVSWLKRLKGTADYVVEDYAVFDKTGHGYSPWPALARGVSFAFPNAPDSRQHARQINSTQMAARGAR